MLSRYPPAVPTVRLLETTVRIHLTDTRSSSRIKLTPSRRALRKRFQHFKPPPLPYNHNGNQPGPDQGYNPYVNNPPPPQSNFHQANSYNGGVQSPPATYQPSMAGQYGHQQSYRGGNDSGNNDHEHGYEWEQAREQERLDRQNAQGTAPPAYDPTSKCPLTVPSPDVAAHLVDMPVGGKSYAPPSGPPPGK